MTASITGKGLKNECASTKIVRDTEIVLSYSILRSTESAHHDLEKQCQKQKKYWVDVVRRVVAVVTFLAERGLPFRGHDEHIGSRHNGNFLGVMELIAEFDPFLAKHVEEFGNQGRGNPSYLSSTIYEEFIQIMAKKVKQKEHIMAEVAPSKYFSVSVDSTPYLTHVDQLTTIIRYVVDGKPVERFLTFHRMISHKADAIATTLLEYLTWKERQSIFNIAVGSPTTMPVTCQENIRACKLD